MVASNVYAVLLSLGALWSKPEWAGGFLHAPRMVRTGISESSKE